MFMCPGVHQISQRADRPRAKQCANCSLQTWTISIMQNAKHRVIEGVRCTNAAYAMLASA